MKMDAFPVSICCQFELGPINTYRCVHRYICNLLQVKMTGFCPWDKQMQDHCVFALS